RLLSEQKRRLRAEHRNRPPAGLERDKQFFANKKGTTGAIVSSLKRRTRVIYRRRQRMRDDDQDALAPIHALCINCTNPQACLPAGLEAPKGQAVLYAPFQQFKLVAVSLWLRERN